MPSAKTKLAVLDHLHPGIEHVVRGLLPDDWEANFVRSREKQERLRVVGNCDAVLLIGAPVDAELIATAPGLRMVQKLGAGMDKIDLESCRSRGIAVARIAGGNAVPVAEHTLMMMLSALRNLPRLDDSVRKGLWLKEQARGESGQISGRRIGLVGFGAIGQAVARLLTGFNADVVFYDPYGAPQDIYEPLNARPVSLDDLLTTSDVVSLHMPLTTETKHLLDARRLGEMKPGAVIVNCARGALIDENALHDRLVDGHIGAAALDVFAAEPPTESRLLALDRVVLTPHCAGATRDNFAHVAARGIGNIKSFLDGGILPHEDVVILP